MNIENIVFCVLFLISECLALTPIEPNGILHCFELIILKALKNTKPPAPVVDDNV
jgi:hypothetical protein